MFYDMLKSADARGELHPVVCRLMETLRKHGLIVLVPRFGKLDHAGIGSGTTGVPVAAPIDVELKRMWVIGHVRPKIVELPAGSHKNLTGIRINFPIFCQPRRLGVCIQAWMRLSSQ
jgi:hypothetical protein